MAEGLDWVFRLIDMFSGPADKMEAAVKKFDGGLKQSASSIDSYVSKLHDIVHTAQIVGGAFERMGRFAFTTFENALKPAMFKEDTMLALETVMRDKQAAKGLFDRAMQLAAATPLTTEQTIGFAKQLVTAGFGPNDTMTMLKAVSDLGALKGFSPVAMDSFVSYLIKIQGFGRLSLDALSDMTRTGLIPSNKVMESVAKVMGVTLPQAMAALHAGTIDSTTGIRGLLTAVAETGGGRLGILTEKGSKTMSGLLSTLVSKPFELLMNLDTSKGFSRVKGFIKDLSDVLEPDSPTGSALMTSAETLLNSLTEAMLSPFEGATTKDKLESAIKQITATIQSIDWTATFRDMRMAFETVGTAVGNVLKLLEEFNAVDKFFREKLGTPGEKGDPIGDFVSKGFSALTGGAAEKRSFAELVWGGTPKAFDTGDIGAALLDKYGLTQPPASAVAGPAVTASAISTPAPQMTLSQFVESNQKHSANVSFNISASDQNQSKVSELKDRVSEAVYSVFENVAIEVGS